ncbi:MAG: hypothetical protein J6K31_11290 [Parabacteroides sp.]|nr:hypothetical protein [Parabacteroides sp.]
MNSYKFLIMQLCLCCLFPLWGQTLQTERVFLATEKESCVPGDTLRVKGQVMASGNGQSNPYSRYVYIECMDDRDSLLLRQKVACREDGVFCTEIPTQLEWESHVCYLRAYTRLMQNYASESQTVVPFLLGTVHPQKNAVVREVHAHIYPESGSLLEGFRQNLVFHLTDDDGFPVVPTQVKLLAANQDTVIHQIAVSDNGLGKFVFQPTGGKPYQLLVEYDGRFFRFPVEAVASGTALQVVLNRKRLACRIFSSEEQALHLFFYHAETGLKEIPLQAGQTSVRVDLTEYPAGSYTLFLTDKDARLLNGRSVWLPPTEPPFDIACRLPQPVYAPEAPLNLENRLPDSSVVFTRVVPRYDLMASQAYPAFGFGNELLSPVRFPLMDSQDWENQMAEINNWLFTARFALFSIEELIKEGMPHTYFAEDVMLLSGTAWEKENCPLPAGTVIEAQNADDQMYYSGTTDEKGHFIFPVDDYASGTRFILSARDSKGKPKNCMFTLDTAAYPESGIPYPLFRQTRLLPDISQTGSSIRYSIDENQDKVYHLDSVTVQARKPVDIRKLSRTPINFIGEIELQKRAGLSLYSVLSRFPTIVVRATSEGGGIGELGAREKRRRFSNEDKERVANLSHTSSSSGGELGVFWRSTRDMRLGGGVMNSKLTVVVDGEIAFGDINYILDQPAGGFKSIEILKPSDTRCIPYNAQGGVLLLQTLRGSGLQPIDPSEPSARSTVYPLGLYRSSNRVYEPLRAPVLPGHYVLLVDVITKDKKVVSFCRPFEVK